VKFKASVKVMLKPAVLDPQGAALERALKSMGRREVESVRVGKLIELVLEASGREAAQAAAEAWADELLANPVLERCSCSVEPLT
jgi:phosphoribosylformylglycinamidine synthase